MRNGSVLIMNFSQDHKKNAEMSTLSVNDWKKKVLFLGVFWKKGLSRNK